MKCIYCNSEKDLTSSDIISYAITGSKLAKSFVCCTHNSFTNDKYEKRFISDLNFFRNRLGLTTRNGKLIKFKADITIGGRKINGVKISNRESLYLPKDVVSGTDNEGKKVLMAPVERLNKIVKSNVDAVDLSDVTLHKTISSNDFVGFHAVHSVAKMAYEWYCYTNNIEEYKPKYKQIVDYILGTDESDYVDIIYDGGYYGAIDEMSEIGTNSFFQYDDINGYRYVVFDLWNVISYRVRICKSSTSNITIISNINLLELYLYRLDGSKSKSKFGVICYDNRKKFSIITLDPKKLNVDKWRLYVKRIEKIMTTMVMSINNLKRIVDSIKVNLSDYDNKKIDVAQLLCFEEKKIINVFEIIDLLYEKKMRYTKSKSFNENLASILKVNGDTLIRTTEEIKSLTASLVEKDKEGTLSKHIKNRIDNFYNIYEIEMERIQHD